MGPTYFGWQPGYCRGVSDVIRLVDLRDSPLSVDEVRAAVADPTAGGEAVFVGAVRDHDGGHDVSRLSYSAPEDPVQGSGALQAANQPRPGEDMPYGAAMSEGAMPSAMQTSGMATSAPEAPAQPVRVEKTPGRNDPCYCGSGKKFKLCHGR